jgi:hypothetical protein
VFSLGTAVLSVHTAGTVPGRVQQVPHSQVLNMGPTCDKVSTNESLCSLPVLLSPSCGHCTPALVRASESQDASDDPAKQPMAPHSLCSGKLCTGQFLPPYFKLCEALGLSFAEQMQGRRMAKTRAAEQMSPGKVPPAMLPSETCSHKGLMADIGAKGEPCVPGR